MLMMPHKKILIVVIIILIVAIFMIGVRYVISTAPTISFTEGTTASGNIYSTLDTGYLAVDVGLITSGVGDRYSFVDFGGDLGLWLRGESNSTDSSTHTNSVSLNGNTTYSIGRFGNGFDFDGSGDYLRVTDDDSLSAVNGLTLSAWIKTSDATENYIITKNNNGDEYFLAVGGGGGAGTLSFHTGGGWLYSDTTVSDNEWHHVVATNDGSTNKLYIDGVLDAQTAVGGVPVNTASALDIGVRSGTSNFYTGLVDDILIFNRDISSDEVLALYDATVNDYEHRFGDAEGDGTGFLVYTAYTFIGHAVNASGEVGSVSRTVDIVEGSSATVTTGSATSITQTSATLGGDIVDDGLVTVTDQGFEYGLTVSYDATASTTGSFAVGSYTKDLTGLICNTTYHYRYFAINDAGTANGNDNTFTTTPCAPTVSTASVSNLGTQSATFGGIISATGGADVTARGFEYGLDTSYGSTNTTSGTFGASAYTASISNLSCDTTYHLRAFATNSAGTAYGDDASFTTQGCPSSGSRPRPSTVTFATTPVASNTPTTPSAVSSSTPAVIPGSLGGDIVIDSFFSQIIEIMLNTMAILQTEVANIANGQR